VSYFFGRRIERELPLTVVVARVLVSALLDDHLELVLVGERHDDGVDGDDSVVP